MGNIKDDYKREYQSWGAMRMRCLNPENKDYPNYGGRGISICEEWNSFIPFYNDMGRRPENTTLNRIDNDKGYTPDNCEWGSFRKQANNRRSSVTVVHNNTTYTVAEVSRVTGVSSKLIYDRLKIGWSAERILTTPANSPRRFEIDGVSMTLSQIAKAKGLNKRTLAARVDNGWSIEDAIETPIMVMGRTLVVDGVVMTIDAAAAHTNQHRDTIARKLSRGLSDEDAIKCGKKPTRR